MTSKKVIVEFFRIVSPYANDNFTEIYGKNKLIYAVTGGCAVAAYSKDNRPISDLDLLLLEDMPILFSKIVEEKTKGKIAVAIGIKEEDRTNNKIYLDLITPSDKFYAPLSSLEEYIENVNFCGIIIPAVCPELLFVSKATGTLPIRQKDIADLKRLKKLNEENKLNINLGKVNKLLNIIHMPLRVSLDHYI